MNWLVGDTIGGGENTRKSDPTMSPRRAARTSPTPLPDEQANPLTGGAAR